MANCNSLYGIPRGCDDNNLGAIKEALIASFEDVEDYTVTATGDEDSDGEITAITMAATTNFEKFEFPKDVSNYTEEMAVDFASDTHSWTQTLNLGFRRFSLRKRNAIMTLAEGRRDLVAIVLDNNGDYWALGFTQGLRLSQDSTGTGDTRATGQTLNVALTSENETKKAYKVDPTIISALLPAA